MQPGERDSRTLSYLQNKPMTAQHLTAHIRPSRILRSGIGEECSSWPGIPVRAKSCAGENERTATGTTTPVRMRYDVCIRSIERDIIDCEAFGNQSHLVPLPKPVFWGIAVSRRVERSSGAASAGRSRLYWDPEQRAHQLPERGDGRCENRAGKPGMSESPLPLPLARRASPAVSGGKQLFMPWL